MAYSVHEFREATVDAIELLAQRPTDASRFYWNGMDLALKMLTDMLWAPVPQTLDPLLSKWFEHWSSVWLGSRGVVSEKDAELFVNLFAPKRDVAGRCRRAEKLLLRLAEDASVEGAGMGGWAQQGVEARAETLLRVQSHRLNVSYSEGGANHAQRRRFNNFEALLYSREGVHLGHLEKLHEWHVALEQRAALVVQCVWRLYVNLRRLRDSAKGQVAQDEAVALRIRADLARQTRESMERCGMKRQDTAEITNALDDVAANKAAGAGALGGVYSIMNSPKSSKTPTKKAAPPPPPPPPAEADEQPVKKVDMERRIAEQAAAAAALTVQSYDPEQLTLDRSFLQSMSMGLPEMS